MTFGDTAKGLPEAPDTLDEEEQLASLESVALDIEMVINDMRSANGVSQKMIRPAMHYLPADVKLNSFTKNPTHTNYQIAMEAMSAGAIGLIGAAVAAVALLFAKIIGWIVSLFKGNDRSTGSAIKAGEQLNETIKRNEQIEKLLTPAMKADFAERKAQRVDPIYTEMAAMWNPMLRDVMTGGAMTRTLGGAEKTFADIIKKMHLMISLIEKEGRKDNGGDHMAAARVMSTLNDIEIHEDDVAIRNLFIPILRVTTQPVNYQADMREVNDHISSLLGQPATAGFSGDKAVADIAGFKVESCPLGKLKPEKQLEQLESEIKRLEKMSFNKNVGVDVDRALRKCISSLRKMLDVVRMFYGLTGRIISQRNKLVELANRAAGNVHSAMVATIVSSDDSKVKDKLRELNKK
ncbi:hypothetical protein D3C85_127990 [compost metagenome]